MVQMQVWKSADKSKSIGSDVLAKNIYYDINYTLSKNCIINYIFGGRGTGKTFGFTEYATKHFKKTGRKFVYVRRYKKEFKRIKNFFDDVKIHSEYCKDIEFDVKGGQQGAEFWIDGNLAGYGIVLATSQFYKGMSFEGVDMILFDEFIIEKGVIRYLPDEVHTLLNLYETIARPGTREYECKLLLFGNTVSMHNPYTTAFDLKLPKKGKSFIIDSTGDIMVEVVPDRGVEELKNASRFYGAVKKTGYGDYAIKNKFRLDSDTFIKKKTGKCEFQFSVFYNGLTFGIWKNYESMRYYVSNDIDPKFARKYAFTTSDHDENTVLMKSVRNDLQYKRFIESYKIGRVYYETQGIKSNMEELFYKVMW